MLNTLLILLRFSPYILIFCAGFYLKGCMNDKLISDLKNQVIENQEKIIITERKLNDYFNSAYNFDFNGLYQRADSAAVSNTESTSSATAERSNKSSDKYRAEYNRCVSELEGFYRKELEKSKKCDEITIKYNSLIDIVNNFLRVQQDVEKINAKNYPN